MRAHYSLALTRLQKKESGKRLMDHISVGYLRDLETLDAGLFGSICSEFNPERIRAIISFFWMQREFVQTESPEAKVMRSRILAFGDKIFGTLERHTTLSDYDKEIAAKLPKLLVYNEALDEHLVKRLLYLMPHLDKRFEVAYFIENLDRLKDRGEQDKTAPMIGQLFSAVVDQAPPDYDKVHIRSIVSFLLGTGATRDLGRAICNTYAKAGFKFLDDLYAKATA